jgi:hypothetical protein
MTGGATQGPLGVGTRIIEKPTGGEGEIEAVEERDGELWYLIRFPMGAGTWTGRTAYVWADEDDKPGETAWYPASDVEPYP